MLRSTAPTVLASLLLGSAVLGSSGPTHAAATDVTIYRCTNAKDHLTLRDTPCRPDEKQETQTMLRPTDPAPSVAPQSVPPPRDAAASAPATTRVVFVSPPRPLYECVTPDGDSYTSETAEGNPRLVPLWTLGFPFGANGFMRGGGTTSTININNGNFNVHARSGNLNPSIHPVAGFAPVLGLPTTLVRDSCHALPPQEVCARLVDRRDEVRRRFFNAMPSERDVLRVEERDINARLDNDCNR